MSDLDFKFDWVDPQGAKGLELRSTWASLTILVGGKPITRLIDERNRSLRDAVHGPLYPMAEWVAMNWWNLLYEVEVSSLLNRSQSYRKRHLLSMSGEGFALPDLWIVPSGQVTDLRWSYRAFPRAGVSFVETGSVSVASDSVRQALFDLVTSVVSRLESEGVGNTPLQEEWKAILTVDPEETAFCKTAAAFGCDPFAMDDTTRNSLISVSSEIPVELFEEFIDATDFSHVADAVRDLKAVADIISHSPASLPSLTDLRRRVPVAPSCATPWDHGYALARELRNLLGLNGHLLASHRELAMAISASEQSFQDALLVPPNPTWGFDALVGTASDGHPAFATTKNRKDSQRFVFCRAMFECLTGTENRRNALVSCAYSDRQRANRAFAAEFLVPEKLLRQRIKHDAIDEEQVDDLAEEFGVSAMVIRHQVENHHIARFAP